MNFMGAKIEKFVRDLKKLSHSYMKQPLLVSSTYFLSNSNSVVLPPDTDVFIEKETI